MTDKYCYCVLVLGLVSSISSKWLCWLVDVSSSLGSGRVSKAKGDKKEMINDNPASIVDQLKVQQVLNCASDESQDFCQGQQTFQPKVTSWENIHESHLCAIVWPTGRRRKERMEEDKSM